MASSTVPARARAHARRLPAPVLHHASFAVLVAVAVVLGRATRQSGAELALIWPAAGVAAVWLARSWRTVRDAAVATILLAAVTGALNAATGTGPRLGLLLGVVNGVQALVWCWLVSARRRRDPMRLSGAADLARLVAAAILAATVAGALAAAVLWSVVGASPMSTGLQWLVRNATGIVVIAAPILVLVDAERRHAPRQRPLAETVAAIALATAIYGGLFWWLDAGSGTFLVLPLSILLAERYGARAGGAHALLAGGAVVVATMLGHGPLAVADPYERAFLAQSFVGVVALVTLAVAVRRDTSVAARLDAESARRRVARQATLVNAVVETARHAIVVYGPDGEVILRNAVAADLLGATTDASSWVDAFDEVQADGTVVTLDRSPVRRVLDGAPGCDIELTPRGDSRSVLAVTVGPLITGPAQVFAGAIVAAYDVTRVRRAATEVRETRDRLASLMDAAKRQIIIGCDQAGVMTVFNGGAALILGYRPEQMIGRPMSDLCDSGQCEAIATELGVAPEAALTELARRDLDGPRRLRLRHSDGGHVVVEMTVSATHDATGMICVAQDVTHQVLAEDRLQDSEERFRLAFDTAPVSLLILDVADGSGRILEANATAADFADETRKGLLTRSLGDLIHPEDRDVALRWFARLRHVPRSESTVEVRFSAAGGTVRWGVLSGRRVGPTSADAQAKPYALCLVQDVTARRQAEAALVRQSLHDDLTGLPNRALLLDRLAEAAASGKVTGLLFCDLDGFKEVNDSFGHAAGDRALREIADRLVGRTRPGDTVARYGGDEFAVVCPGVASHAELERVAARLLEVFDVPLSDEDGAISVGMSVGMLLVPPGTDPDVAVAWADAAMYEAKRAGKNCVRTYSAEDTVAAEPPSLLLPQLRRALAAQQFVLYGQSIVDLDSRRTVAVEMLLRWQHPALGLVPPAEFLGALESSSLMVPVGRWVLQEACRQGGAWARQLGADAPQVHVNVAAAQLEQPDFVDDVLEALESAQLPPHLLVLEITETKMPRFDQLLASGLGELRRHGVGIAMDDVGTGYAGLSQLTELPIDVLKLDRRFVSGLGHDGRCEAVMKAVLGLGEALGLEAIAEGVETADQARILREAGYTRVQGFLFARPAPLDDIALAPVLERARAG